MSWENAVLTTERHHVLLLAGTFEARQLAKQLADTFPNLRLTASFAGVVRDLPDLGVATRIGGFGGVDGLVGYATTERVSLIVDATHPFAAQMSWNVAQAAEILGVPLVRLERPEWRQEGEDQWTHVSSITDATSELPTGARAFLAVGRKEIGAFYGRADIYGLARMIEPPTEPLPTHWDLILSRPPLEVADECDHFRKHRITHVVTKNSGGTRAFAKLEAARRLSLPIIMIDRPRLPAADTAVTTDKIVKYLTRFLNIENS
ncbi:MAG: cobalt-precorrin-6A reductase [Roseibium sp.]